MSRDNYIHLTINISNRKLALLIYRYAKAGAFSELNLDGSDLSDYYWASGRYESYEDYYNKDKLHSDYETDLKIMEEIYDTCGSGEDISLNFSITADEVYVIPKRLCDVIPCLIEFMLKEYHWKPELFERLKGELLAHAHEMTESFEKVIWKDAQDISWPPEIHWIDRFFTYDGDANTCEYTVTVRRSGK